MTKTFSERMEESLQIEGELADILFEELGMEDYETLWMDPYDNSLELSKVPSDYRFPPEKFDLIKSFGFSIIWLNHVDGYETMYTFWKDKDTTNWENHYPMGPTKKKRLGLTKEE